MSKSTPSVQNLDNLKLNIPIETAETVLLRERQLAYVLEKFSERKGKPTKSTHKMRKTYASRLVACGMPIEHVRQELGHRYLSSTYDYIFNPFTKDETYELIAQAFDKNPVLNCTQSSEQ